MIKELDRGMCMIIVGIGDIWISENHSDGIFSPLICSAPDVFGDTCLLVLELVDYAQEKLPQQYPP